MTSKKKVLKKYNSEDIVYFIEEITDIDISSNSASSMTQEQEPLGYIDLLVSSLNEEPSESEVKVNGMVRRLTRKSSSNLSNK